MAASKIIRSCLFALCAIFLSSCAALHPNKSGGSGENRCLLIVLDGLRPDYVTPALMPNLFALGKGGIVCANHHSVFPTVTRVNAASIATGSYPATHGLLGNSVYFPEVDPSRGLSTGDAANLQRIEAATGGQLLTAPSLGEILEQHGKKILAISSGSSGSAFLLNHKIKGAGIINVDMILPAALETEVKSALGPAPRESEPNRARNHWAVDAYLEFALKRIKPDLTILWISDPDHTAHEAGIGSPLMLDALRADDQEIGRILAAHHAMGLEGKTNIMVTSDHGFSTHTGGGNIASYLMEKGLKAAKDSDDVRVVEGAIYVKDHNAAKVREIALALGQAPWVGAIFTHRSRPTHPEGFVSGTLSFEVAHWNHPRAADILVSANWSDAPNKLGWKGTTAEGGVAGHGSSSPWDIHNTLLAAGPDFKRRATIPTPTCNVDLAPTILNLLGIERPQTMNGRVIREALRGGPNFKNVQVLERTYRSVSNDPSCDLQLFESSVEGTDYLNLTTVKKGN